MTNPRIPSLFDWIGGIEPLTRLTTHFYEHVKSDPVLAPVFAHMGADHPAHEQLLFRAVDELHDTSTISDTTWHELTQHYSLAQLVELIALIGNYHAISFMTNAARVELEPFAPRFHG